jgi:hypothetical protein
MAKLETATFGETTRPPKPSFRGLEFLAAQFFTILATVVGVYLAGYVGFQRNLEYDRYQKAQQKSDLLTATEEELKQNLARVRKFNDGLPADVGNPTDAADWPRLRLFVWQATGHSSSAFDLPPQILTDLQAFYGDLDEMLNDADAHHNFLHLTVSNVYDRTQFKKRMNDRLSFAETSILPALDTSIAASEGLIKKYSTPD